MNNFARVSAIKSITRAQDIRELLQEAGVPRDRANEAARLAWKAINSLDDEAEDDAELERIFSASAARIAALVAKR